MGEHPCYRCKQYHYFDACEAYKQGMLRARQDDYESPSKYRDQYDVMMALLRNFPEHKHAFTRMQQEWNEKRKAFLEWKEASDDRC